MIGVAMYTTIQTLWKKHKNKSLIAKLTGHDWKTVAKRIKEIEQEKEYQPKKPHPRILDPYHEQILKWIEEDLSGVRIHEKIQQKGVKVGYTTVKDYLIWKPISMSRSTRSSTVTLPATMAFIHCPVE
jgi:transposase